MGTLLERKETNALTSSFVFTDQAGPFLRLHTSVEVWRCGGRCGGVKVWRCEGVEV